MDMSIHHAGTVSAAHVFKGKGVAPARFELASLAPKAGMIDRYTTGLLATVEARCQTIRHYRGRQVTEHTKHISRLALKDVKKRGVGP